MPENQAGAGFLLNAEEVEFGAELPVIAAFGFLDAVEMRFELLLSEECHRINALELGIAFLTLPVSAGDVHQFERLDALGRRNVRATAEIDELPGGVEGNHRLGGLFFDQFALKNLVALLVEIESLGLGDKLALVRQILRREFVHLLFDFCEVFLGEGLLAQEFIEKAGVNGRTDAELYVWIQLHNGSGEQVGRGMAEHKERIGIFFCEDLQLDVVIQGPP